MTYTLLARRDELTALPNRLALREYFDENPAVSSRQGLIAAHYLDLDGFKPVNDHYGHDVGDTLLTLVGERLLASTRGGDIVARLGGDEFAILQFDLQRTEDAQLLSQRVVSAISEPFQIGEHSIRITACIGTVWADAMNSNLDDMLMRADRNLYAAKQARISSLKAA